MKLKFRAQSVFPVAVTKAITNGQTSKNSGDSFAVTAKKVKAGVLESLSNEDTKTIGYAGFKLIPNISIVPIGDSKTVIDLFINSFAILITNDVLMFIGASESDLLDETDLVDGEYDVILKSRRSKPLPSDIGEISDELRDELSGKDVVASGDGSDNSCGDSCSI